MLAEVLLPLPLDKPFHYSVPEGLKISPGQRVSVPFGSRMAVGYVARLVDEIPGGRPLKSINSSVDPEPLVGPEAIHLADWMAKTYACSHGEAMAGILPLALQKSEKPLIVSASIPVPNHHLTPDQAEIFNNISQQLSAGPKAFLIHGVTDSGKTEIYVHLIQTVIAQGRGAIFLLPEISLTPQFVGALKSRLSCAVAVWHSRLSAQERSRTWSAIKRGEVPVVLGTRSAVFAPLEKLGLIVMDEEHDASYKQEQKPMYHVREVALERIRWHKAVLVMGSATPSVESYWRAQQGEFQMMELKERVLGRPLPPVFVVDQRHEKEGRKLAVISDAMLKALEQHLAKREQAILLINRRGYSPFVLCQNCGTGVRCPACDVALVFHKEMNQLLCHYCGHKEPLPTACARCQSLRIRLAGVGTEKVVEEIIKHFPYARILRMDRDTAKGKQFFEKAYQQFQKEEYDILVGTQMVAKGFHFPRVTLVGVVDADTALHIPDFRAAERTFQLITQVSGRPGRSELGGEVIIQTYHPDHYAVISATRHDYQSFYRQELKYRRELRYPPFTKLCNILLHGSKEAVVREQSQKLFQHMKDLADRMHLPTEVIGPTAALRPRLRQHFRYQILLKGMPAPLVQLVEGLRAWRAGGGVKVVIDVDPVSLL